MLKPTVDQVNEVVLTEMMKWVVVSSSRRSRQQLDELSDRLIRFFILFNIPHLPTTSMVGEIILSHLVGWNRKAGELERKAELDALSEGLIAYFAAFEPTAAILPGLPGGDAA